MIDLSARDRITWHSAFQPLITAALVLAFTFGAIQLHKGWKSAWRKQQRPMAATQPYVPPVDPMLANDPDVKDAAKIKVIGPLASQLQNSAGPADLNMLDANEPAPAAPVNATPAGVDLVKGFRHLPPMRLFHGRMSVEGYRDLPFEVPAHASLPRIKGSYKQLGNGPRKAGLLLLSEQQFRDFLAGNLAEAVFSNDDSSGAIDIALSPTYVQSQKYHLVLHSSSRASLPMEADFTVSFD